MEAAALPEQDPVAPSLPPYYRPYGVERPDHYYNWVFADDWRLWDGARRSTAGGSLASIFNDPFDESAVRRIAEDATIDSLFRLLAFRRLREHRRWIGEVLVLGVVIEFPMDRGLDTLAAYQKPSVLYLHQAGHSAVLEGSNERACQLGQALVGLCEKIVDKTPLSAGPRAAPPTALCRISILGSDGVHVIEGTEQALEAQADTLAVMRLAGLIVQTTIARMREDQQTVRQLAP